MRLYIYKEQVTTYYITTEGKLYNSKTKRWLKGQISKNGYHTYHISIDGEKKRLYAHRMVSETYLPKIPEKNEVNHKDGIKTNNSLENLEWVSSSENKIHAMELGLREKGKPVYCFDKNKKLLCKYESIADAARMLKVDANWLREQAGRSVKTLSYGYYWSHLEDNSFETKPLTGIKKPVGQYNAKMELVSKYESRNEAARETGYDKKRIGECCNGKIKTYRGYYWKYLI